MHLLSTHISLCNRQMNYSIALMFNTQLHEREIFSMFLLLGHRLVCFVFQESVIAYKDCLNPHKC